VVSCLQLAGKVTTVIGTQPLRDDLYAGCASAQALQEAGHRWAIRQC
jgi:hypothetical protein